MQQKITKPSLEVKQPVGNGVSAPLYGDADALIARNQPSMSGGDSAPKSASAENRSAKFKNPRVRQDVPAAGRNQYE